MKSDKEQRPVRVGLISLGCAKNLVDAEIMLGSLLKSGAEITNDAAQADVVIVNTCSFIDSAQEESVDTILESAELRDNYRPSQGLIVSGCLPQRFRDELPRLLPEVDAFMGIDQVAQVADVVRRALEHRAQRLASESSTFKISGAKLKVAARLAELDKSRKPIAVKEERIPGTKKPDQDRTVAARHSPRSASNSRSATDVPPPGSALLDVLVRPTYIPDFATPRFRLTPPHFAYVKIAEGCNHPCSFCIIPRMRGSHRSRPQADLVQEARQLIAEGVKELNLISQDSTYYGLDLRPNHSRNISAPDKFKAAANSLSADATTLSTLLRELNALPGDFWIRLLYTHPAHWTDDLIQTIAECPKVARYVDMPLQHIHDNMLERMRRETSRHYIVNLIKQIRAGVPGISLRTTFIVGFPGETEACFRTLLDFIRETRFERLGVFTYSKEEGTRAAKMDGQIPDRLKNKRRDLAMAVQRRIAGKVAESFVGRTMRVLVEKKAGQGDLSRAAAFSWEHGLIRDSAKQEPAVKNGGFLIARGEGDAPDIDGRVYVRGKLPLGEFAQVRIIGHTDYDLFAEPA